MSNPQKSSGSNSPFNPAAMRAILERALILDGAASGKRSKEQQAQEIVYQAMEASTWDQKMFLVNQALDIDKENVDALLMLANAAALNRDERIEVFRNIVKTGEKRLKKKAFKELVPHFWGFIETRPYMRARLCLAEELRTAGHLEEAVVEFEGMLILNENDNQGVRYLLLPCLLALGRLDVAQALMNRFKDECDWSVVFAWCAVLLRHLSGDASTKELSAARKKNGHMEAYLKGHRKVAKNLPDSYSLGSKEEALCYAEPLLVAWTRYPRAKAWLISQPKSAS